MFRCFILICCLIAGCSSKDKLKNRSADSIYKKGCALLKEEEYMEAASEFKDIETFFPYSNKASEGKVLAAYCYFLTAKYMDSIREIDVFLRYHTSHKLVAYAMYLKAMCLYMQVASIGRDPKVAIDAKFSFVELANKFPESKYHSDCLHKVVLLDDIIAAHEMMVGRYYQANKNSLSAISRYMFVFNNYQSTNYAREAAYRIIECCYSVGLKNEARNAYQALAAKYPNSFWTKKAEFFVKKNMI